MAQTITAVISAQSFGTSTNVGDEKFADKTALQAGTTLYSVTLSMTNGATVYDLNQRLRLWYTTSPLDSTEADAPKIYGTTARYLDVIPSRIVSGIAARISPTDYIAGGFFYCWVSAPKLPTAATFTVTLVETPIT